ncbi:hypothetical protein FIBSPDRAFT_1038818 [Athelia psychrophila]|uniref:Peptidase S53 activation domain-containing protein n=1 Tax=Athelia psychrophila TaxID=1759441 RepID=A0A166SGR5_9AGAM|nr:hypothetical protein FIBSPDRAFT_1038818 [Fibularhizoctonia sp. CBS 109695]
MPRFRNSACKLPIAFSMQMGDILVLSLISVFFSTALGSPLSRDLAPHESLASVPNGYTSNGPAPADSMLNLRFNLAAGNISGLQSILYEISTPGNANYGNHLTRDELAAYVKPTSQAVSLLHNWILSHNLTGTSASFTGDILEVSLPVSKANSLLDADFQLYTAHASGRQAIRAVSYSIPAALKGHLDNIHPTVNFPVFPSSTSSTGPVPSVPSSKSSSSLPASCNTVITPKCIQDLYGIPPTLATQSSNKLFVSGLLGQYANQADITTFLEIFRPDLASNTSFAFISVANGTNPQNVSEAGVEADLDMQYTIGLASGVPVTFVSVGPNLTEITSLDDFFIALQNEANYLLSLETPPTVLTSSYSLNEGYVTRSLAK